MVKQLRLKKPAKDHRGEWDLVLDNDGTTFAAIKLHSERDGWAPFIEILWPFPVLDWATHAFEWHKPGLLSNDGIQFFKMLGIDTSPLEKLIVEREAQAAEARDHAEDQRNKTVPHAGY